MFGTCLSLVGTAKYESFVSSDVNDYELNTITLIHDFVLYINIYCTINSIPKINLFLYKLLIFNYICAKISRILTIFPYFISSSFSYPWISIILYHISAKWCVLPENNDSGFYLMGSLNFSMFWTFWNHWCDNECCMDKWQVWRYIEDLNITPSLSLTTPLLQIEDKYCHVNKTTCWLYPEKWSFFFFFFLNVLFEQNQFLSVVVYINSLSKFRQFVIRILFESHQKQKKKNFLPFINSCFVDMLKTVLNLAIVFFVILVINLIITECLI